MKRKHPEVADAGASITRRPVPLDAAGSPEGTRSPHSPPDGRLDCGSPEDRGRDGQICPADDSTGAGSRDEDEALLDDSPGGHSWSSHDGSLPMSSGQGSYEAPSGILSIQGARQRADSQDLQVLRGWTSWEAHTAHGMTLYFDMCAPALPIIHQATFDPGAVPEFLLLAMLSIGLQYSDRSAAVVDTATHYYERAVALVDSIDDAEVSSAKDALLLAQSLFLLEICAVLYLCGRHSATGFRLHTRLITLARSHRLLQASPRQGETMAGDLEAVWQHFVFTESCKRTILAVHQMDALWYHLLSVPRLLSHLEIKHDLPCPASDWEAPSSAQWAYCRLTRHSPSSTCPTYADAVRQILASDCPAEHILAASDPFGLTSFAHFALSSIREVSGWSSITGCVSMDRVEPLKASLHTISPCRKPTNGTDTSGIADNIAFRATWEMAMIDLRIWSISHTDGVVHSSINAALEHSTHLAVSRSLIFSAEILHTIQPHVDWFLSYLDTAPDHVAHCYFLPFAYATRKSTAIPTPPLLTHSALRPPHTPENQRTDLRPPSQAIVFESPIFGQGLAASQDGLEIFLVRAVDGKNGSYTIQADYQEQSTLEGIKALADSAMSLDLSFLEPDLIELLNDAGMYDASVRQMDKVILRKETPGDEETFCVDVCYSMQHNGNAVILKHKFGGLDEVCASFSLTADGFELSAGIDNEAYNAQYAAFSHSDAKELGNHIKVVDPNIPARFVINDNFLSNIEFEKQQKLVDFLKMKCSLAGMDVAASVRGELSWPVGALKGFRLEHEPRGPSYVYTLTFKYNSDMPMGGQHNLEQRSNSEKTWKPEDYQVCNHVDELMTANDKNVKIELRQFPPPPKNKSKKDPESDEALVIPEVNTFLAKILPHIPGTPESEAEGGFVLESFEKPPYYAWLNNNGRITVQPGLTRAPLLESSREKLIEMLLVIARKKRCLQEHKAFSASKRSEEHTFFRRIRGFKAAEANYG
ncbi:hypothetical protein CBER1_10367 [Cercospora berteroae]|uniref:Xylanolytic transcriptional activator regulatory domain-containing protein n=1 Tax=Cercospora berteroae TaxID=357750 RepID=A0A2S6BXM0_9PEZI|nr:hypothetical protein CBER1_10367 [Cercospora berteroae]